MTNPAPTKLSAPGEGRGPSQRVPGGVGTGGAPYPGAPPEPPRPQQRDADAIAQRGISAVLVGRYGAISKQARLIAANAALTAAADWCRSRRRQLQQDLRRDDLTVADRRWIDDELRRLAHVVPADPNPIYAELARTGSSDPHRDRVVDGVRRQLVALIGGLDDEQAVRVAGAIVDGLGVA